MNYVISESLLRLRTMWRHWLGWGADWSVSWPLLEGRVRSCRCVTACAS